MLSEVWLFGQQRLQAFLAFGEGKGAQIFAACEQQIEDEEDQVLDRPSDKRRLQRREIRRAAVIEGDDLAVDDRIGQTRGGLGDGLELVGPVEAFARAQGGSAIL